MNKSKCTRLQIQHAFHTFCEQTLINEALLSHKKIKIQKMQEISIPELTAQEKSLPFSSDTGFDREENKSPSV